MNPPPAIPAATLIIVRERPAGVELLMVERSGSMAFAPGALVFPGGRIDEGDRELGAGLGIEQGAALVAAVRETVEETAIPVGLAPTPTANQALEIQSALLSGTSFATLLRDHALAVDAGALTLFAHWIPGFHPVRRFDTRFFVAAAPPGDWQPIVGERENARAEWIGAAEALRRDESGEASLIFPTRSNLRRLARHDSLAAIRDDARRHPVEPITPWVEERDGTRMLTIPAHLGYPVTQEAVDALWRG